MYGSLFKTEILPEDQHLVSEQLAQRGTARRRDQVELGVAT